MKKKKTDLKLEHEAEKQTVWRPKKRKQSNGALVTCSQAQRCMHASSGLGVDFGCVQLLKYKSHLLEFFAETNTCCLHHLCAVEATCIKSLNKSIVFHLVHSSNVFV